MRSLSPTPALSKSAAPVGLQSEKGLLQMGQEGLDLKAVKPRGTALLP